MRSVRAFARSGLVAAGLIVSIGAGATGAMAAPGGGGDPTRPVCTTPGVTYPDFDKDFLTDCQETKIYGTDPQIPDTDGDGMVDGAEVIVWHSNPLVFDPDSDGDGAQDPIEVAYGWDPLNPDTDGDGLTDSADMRQFCTPNSGKCAWFGYALDPDVDDDGLLDGEEHYTYHTSAANPDTDNDGLSDGKDVALGLDPLNPDTDFDFVWDGVEVQNGTDPLDPDSN